MKTTEQKKHYRRVFKSDHLGVADLEEMQENGKSLILTIAYTLQHLLEPNNKNSGVVVAGKRISANIAFFTDTTVKPLVLNSTNSKVIASFTKSSFVDDWKNVKIQLYIDPNVKMKGSVVGGVRINPIQPKEKIKPKFTDVNFEKAKTAKATIEQIKKAYSIDSQTEKQYLEYVGN